MIYECPRCGYNSKVNTNFKKHLLSKTLCNPTKADITLDDIKNEFFNKKVNNQFECECCHKNYSTKETLRMHKKICKKNNDIDDEVTDISLNNDNTDNDVNQVVVSKNKNDSTKIVEYKKEIQRLKSEVLYYKTKPKTQQDQENDRLKQEIERQKLELIYYKTKRNETYYQKFLEKVLGAGHKRLKCGETDITTEKFHAEIKEFKHFKGAIGQLLCYNNDDPKEELRLYLFGSYKESKMTLALENCKSFNITIYHIVDNSNGTISIHNMDNNENSIYSISGELSVS
jgi:hypothetical protein